LLTQVPTDWSIAGLGDFNADGTTDILWRNTDGRAWIHALGRDQNGQPMIRADAGGLATTVPSEWNVAGVGDFNGDGRADILWFRPTDGTAWLYEMDGNRIIGGGLVAIVGQAWQVAGIGDLNGDGRADIVWRNVQPGGPLLGSAFVYLMDGPGIIGSGTVAGVQDPLLRLAEVADLNADGMADLLWRYESGPQAGAISVSFMHGASSTSAAPLPVASVPTDWQIIG
jgi:hypothetical protein